MVFFEIQHLANTNNCEKEKLAGSLKYVDFYPKVNELIREMTLAACEQMLEESMIG